jgi:hypothetical protein
MRKFLSFLFLSVFALASMLSVAPEAFAQGTPVVVRVAPATAQVAVGQTVDLAIEVVNVTNMYGFDIDLSFDPSAVEVVDADPNSTGVQVSLGTFMDSGFAIINQADNVAGSLRFAMTQLNPSTAKSGTGNLLVVRFTGKLVNKTSEIKVNSIQIAQMNGAKIPTSPVSGQIQVVQNNPGPTNTGIATRGAGTPMPTENPVSPSQNTATQRPTAAYPTAQSQPASTAGSLANPTATGLALPTMLSPTPVSALVTSAESLAATPAQPTQPVPGVLTPVQEVESSAESPNPTSTPLAGAATPAVATPAAPAITLTELPPTQGASGSFLLAASLFGAIIIIGLGGILLGFIVALIIIKRRRPG